jgi:hypothetical protein
MAKSLAASDSVCHQEQFLNRKASHTFVQFTINIRIF